MEKEQIEKLKKQWEQEPTTMFMIEYSRMLMERVMDYCLERTNHHKTMEEYKKELKRDITGLHKKSMNSLKMNIEKLFI